MKNPKLFFAIFSLLFWKTLLFAQITATDNADVQIFPSANSQHEVHISINKTNPLNLVVSSNTSDPTAFQGYYFTLDGGVTWNGADNLPNAGTGAGDPATAFDAEGRAYLTTMSTPSADPNGYFVQTSTNLGVTWTNQVRGVGPTSGGFDKEMIAAVDEMQSSPFANFYYCAWTDFNDSRLVKINRSTDQGVTFDNQRTLSTAWGQGVNVQTGPNGEVYVCWADYTDNDFPAKNIGFAVSTDGGDVYNSGLVFAYNSIRTNPANPNFGGTRVNDFPAMAVDKSCGPNRGRIYIVYSEFETAASTRSVIRVRFSDNQGTTWSAPSTVNIAAGQQNWFPWIAVDDLSGLVTVVYFSLDQMTGVATNTYVAYSGDGTLWQNILVSDASHISAPIAGFAPGYAGDYIGIAAFGGAAYAAWMDDRSGNWQVYVSRIDFDVPILISSQTNLVINSPAILTGNRRYEAVQNITVANLNNVTVANTANVEMVAGQSIRLFPGFSTQLGARYRARIAPVVPCSTPGSLASKTQALTEWGSSANILKKDSSGIRLFAYPNPSADYITVGLLNKGFNKVKITLNDVTGKTLATYLSPEVTKEQIRQVLDVKPYPTGMYFIVMEVDDKVYSLKLQKI